MLKVSRGAAILILFSWRICAWGGESPQRLICVVAEKDCCNLVVINADGSERKTITSHQAERGKRNEIIDFACAPDASRVAYSFAPTVGASLLLADFRAGGSRPLTKESGMSGYRFASWSHDGRYIGSLKEGSMFDQQVVLIDATSGAEKQLTKTDDTKTLLKWSPDGQRIAYISKARIKRPDGASFDQGEILVLPVNGGVPVNVSKNTGNDCFFAWSSDGKQLAFVCQPVKEQQENMTVLSSPEIWIVPVAGGPARKLTVKPDSFDEEPAWSPDGNRIAFTSVRDGGSNSIYVMNADGSDAKCLTDKAWGKEQSNPQWSPDGTRIAYAEEKDWVFTIFTMNPDGSDQRSVLTDVKAFAWVPNP